MSAREREVLERLLAGRQRDIARLGISPARWSSIGPTAWSGWAHNLPEAVRLALAAGVAPPRTTGADDEGAS